MTSRRLELEIQGVARQVGSMVALGGGSGLTDAQLLGRFLAGEGSVSALAFEALVGRHGPMVLRVCRGVLRDPHDAQDAFQATFLVLVRKAGLDPRSRLAGELAARGRPPRREPREGRRGPAPTARTSGRAGGNPGPSVPTRPTTSTPKLHEEIDRLPSNTGRPSSSATSKG